MRPSWYDLDAAGEPVPRDSAIPDAEWWRPAYIVGRDDNIDGSGVTVSTVFLRLDHAWDDGPPVLWETLVMGGDLDGEMDRYRSRAEAVAGHAAMVARVRASLASDIAVRRSRRIELE